MLEYSNPVPISPREREEYLEFAREVSRVAGAATLQYFRAGVVVENKLDDGSFDPVTAADRSAESVLREAIGARFPEHGILGEEYGHQAGNGLTWVIDPVDGTRAFIAGMLHWGLLLALFDGRRPVLGVMYQPFTGELFSGDGRQAEYQQGSVSRPLRTRSCSGLSDAVMTTTSPRLFREGSEREGFEALEGSVKLSRYGGDCYIYAMLAMGCVDLATDATLKAHDIQALIPIIEGAGGVVTTYDGGDACMGGTVLASGSRVLHESALELINR